MGVDGGGPSPAEIGIVDPNGHVIKRVEVRPKAPARSELATATPIAEKAQPAAALTDSSQEADGASLESRPTNDQIIAATRNATRILRDAVADSDGKDFSNPEAKQIAEEFLAAYKDIPDAEIPMDGVDVKKLLAAIDGLSYTGQEADVVAKAMANINEAKGILSQNTEIISGSETRSLEEWEKMAKDTSNPTEQAKAQAALKDGQYVLKFDPEPAAATPVPEADMRTAQEIRNQNLNDLVAKIREDKEAKLRKRPPEDVSREDELLLVAEGARASIGKPLEGYIVADALKVLGASYKDVSGAEGLQLSPEDAAKVNADRVVARELLLKNMEAAGMGRFQAEAILDLADGGNFDETMKNFPVFKSKNVAELITGLKFKNQEEATKYMEKMMGQLEEEKYKRLKRMGLVAALILLAGSAVMNSGMESVSQSGSK